MKSSKLIIDTNLLVLLIIGAMDECRHIKKSKRLSKYTKQDYDLIVKIMQNYREIGITPYIAAEVSNLIDLKVGLKDRAFNIAREIFKEFELVETNVHKDTEHPSFIHFGIADASLVILISDYVVLTADERLLLLLYRANKNNVLPFCYAKELYLRS